MCLGGGGGATYDQSYSVDYGVQPPAPMVPRAPEVPDTANPSVVTPKKSTTKTTWSSKGGYKGGNMRPKSAGLKLNQPTGSKAGSGGLNY